jgi:hypothetical protein
MKSEVVELKKLKVWSVAKVLLVIGLILGLLQGISLSFAAQQTLLTNPELSSMSFSDEQVVGNAQAMLGLGLIKLGYWNILVMPIALAMLYFLGGIISALIYNLIARYIGGIKIVLN